MPRIVRTAKAEQDLIEIWLHIAQDNPVAADALLDEIGSACELLADNPGIGPARFDLAPQFRYYIVRKFLILYRETKKGVEIVRVVHGARHLPDVINA